MDSTQRFDPEAVKGATRRQWEGAAQGWNDYAPMFCAWLADSTSAMLATARLYRGALFGAARPRIPA